MAESGKPDVNIQVTEEQVPITIFSLSTSTNTSSSDGKPFFYRHRLPILAGLSIFFVLTSEASATLLSRFYFADGGNSKWLATLVQFAGVPLLFPLLLLPCFTATNSKPTVPATDGTRTTTTMLIYAGIGLLIAADEMLYMYGVANLPVSTYSLLCATQLAFNSITSLFLNSEKFTPPVLNSLVLLTFSSILLAVRSDAERPAGVSPTQYVIGFICTLAASFLYALVCSLMQLFFQNYFKKETFSIVLEMHIYTDMVAIVTCLAGLFLGGNWKKLSEEYHSFEAGKISYGMSVAWIAILCQISSISVMGLIFTVSSLFSSVISTMALPIVPVLAIFIFHDNMDPVKVISLLMSLWGFTCYVYDQYVQAGGKHTLSFSFKQKKQEVNRNHLSS